MSRAQTRSSRNRISIWNWMGTILLCMIPGVNIIALILFLFLAKAQPKRTFAWAALILMLVFVLLTLAAFIAFPAQLISFSAWLTTQADAIKTTAEPVIDATATIAPVVIG